MINDKQNKSIVYKSTEWLLLVFVTFALTLHNVTLLPNLNTELSRIALTVSTVGMNIITYVYFPYKSIKKW